MPFTVYSCCLSLCSLLYCSLLEEILLSLSLPEHYFCIMRMLMLLFQLCLAHLPCIEATWYRTSALGMVSNIAALEPEWQCLFPEVGSFYMWLLLYMWLFFLLLVLFWSLHICSIQQTYQVLSWSLHYLPFIPSILLLQVILILSLGGSHKE